ncbi:MAG: c-type cytochrome, partial [Planctomycetes bacterium]|nr:c-type cytochrome [Planctomycetota bacterium]
PGIGPSLATAGLLYSRDWLYDFLLAPSRVRPELPGRMPRFYFTASEAADIAHALEELASAGHPELALQLTRGPVPSPGSTSDPEAGRRIFIEADCHSCHVRGEESFPPVVAPYFTGEEQEERKRWAPDHAHASRLSRAALLLQIEDPARVRPDARMPRITLSREEREALADYLQQKE